MASFVQDLRYAFRTYLKTPGFTATAILVLAIGIGANSAMFTVVNSLLFKPLSGQAGDLVGLFSRDRTRAGEYRGFSYPNYVDIRAGTNDIFAGLMAHTFAMVGVSVGDTTKRSFVSVISSNYFDTLGVSLAAGRTFTADEERPGAQSPIVIANYNDWKAVGLNPAFIGSRRKINATEFTIVGVAPPGFTGTMALVTPEMWVPLGVFDTIVNDMFKNSGTGLHDRNNHGLILAGRLKPGLNVEAVRSRLDVVSRQLEKTYPAENKNQLLSTHPLSRVSTSTSPQSNTGPVIGAAMLMAVSGVVLVIACLNIANMLLARGAVRRKEIAIRIAIGGGRGRVVRQLVTESFLLALIGSSAGLVLAFWATDLLFGSLVGILPLTLTFDAKPDATIVLVTTAIAAMATIIFGIGPALRISRADLATDLKSQAGSNAVAGSRSAFSARNVLVVGQIALSLALLCTGGLFARGALNAAAADPGYAYDRLLLVSLDPSMAAYDESRGRTAYRGVLERVRGIAGVEAASFVSTVPFGDFHEGMPVEAVGAPVPEAGRRSPTYRIIGSDYFRALGLRMVRGREFTSGEEESSLAPRVAIVDEILARRLFPNQDPMGQMIRLSRRAIEARGTAAANDGEPMQIIGIAPPVRDNITDREPVPHLYVPSGRHYRASMHLHVRVAPTGSEPDVLSAIRRELRQFDSALPVLDLMSMQQFHDRSLELWAVSAGGKVVISLGTLALILAVVGVYGVKSYVVSQRTREIGIRMALGARPTEVLWLVLSHGVSLTAVGIAIGLPLAALIGMASRSLLYNVSPIDPVVFAIGPVTLTIAALFAAWLPARRATRVTPVTALRVE